MERRAAYTLVGTGLIFAGVIIIYTLFSKPSVIIHTASDPVNSSSVSASSDENTTAEIVSTVMTTDLPTVAEEEISYPIDLNTATANELAQGVPGIGEVLASRIVEYREIYGPYTSVDDLLIISGISQNKLDSIRGYITVG